MFTFIVIILKLVKQYIKELFSRCTGLVASFCVGSGVLLSALKLLQNQAENKENFPGFLLCKK